MAITLQQEPNFVSPVYNPIYYTFRSNNYSQPQFKFICELYINGILRHTEKIPVKPSLDSATFHVNRILESFITYDKEYDSTEPVYCGRNSVCTYYLDIGEEYEVAGTLTEFSSLTATSEVLAFNGSLNHRDWMLFAANEYFAGASTSKFLTDMGSTPKLATNQKQWLGIFSDYTSADIVKYLCFKTYDNTGAVIQTVKFINTDFNPPANLGETVLYFPVGWNANDIVAAPSTGAQPIYDSTVAKCEVYLEDITPTRTSEIITFQCFDPCANDDEYDIKFLNRLGQFETFRFTRRHVKGTNVTRKEYKPINYSVNAINGNITYNFENRGVSSYYVVSDETWTLKSNWLTDAESINLMQLIESPEVYLIDVDPTGSRPDYDLAINVVNTSYEKKTTKTNQLFLLELQIKFSTPTYRQRG
jgi:hypothetical protein